MISRLWRGVVRPECASAYIEHLQRETSPALQRLSGFQRMTILNRPCDLGVEFLVVTVWDSEESIVAFAGADAQAAVVPEKVRLLMVEFDDRARHFNTIE